MKILDFINTTEMEKMNQTQRAGLLCYFHYKTTDESTFDLKGINELFSDAGYSSINTSRVKKGLLDNKIMRVPKGLKTSLEFVPATLQEYDQKYSALWNDATTIQSDNELIDESKFCKKRTYLDKLIQQINCCYGNNCYDAAAVLMRRLFEILLILSYQQLGIDDQIKTKDGKEYLMLDKIVKDAENNQTLKLSRIKNEFDTIRKVGNFSAHNITYTAGKQDIDNIKLSYRVMLEELYNKAGLM